MPEKIDYLTPKPCNLGQSNISEFAEGVAKDFGYSPGADLNEFVETLGGEISYESLWDLESSSSGSIQINGVGDFKIHLAMHTSQARDRFTVAHELGHYFLHYLYPYIDKENAGPMRAARYGNGLVEYEANWFAASLLMPKKAFSEEFTRLRGNTAQLADRFGVSVSAAEVRCQVLGLN